MTKGAATLDEGAFANVKIEKGIPIPPSRGGGAPHTRRGDFCEKIRSMEVGDSMFFKGKKPHQVARYFSEILGPGNYTSRTLENGTRIWRTK